MKNQKHSVFRDMEKQAELDAALIEKLHRRIKALEKKHSMLVAKINELCERGFLLAAYFNHKEVY